MLKCTMLASHYNEAPCLTSLSTANYAAKPPLSLQHLHLKCGSAAWPGRAPTPEVQMLQHQGVVEDMGKMCCLCREPAREVVNREALGDSELRPERQRPRQGKVGWGASHRLRGLAM